MPCLFYRSTVLIRQLSAETSWAPACARGSGTESQTTSAHKVLTCLQAPNLKTKKDKNYEGIQHSLSGAIRKGFPEEKTLGRDLKTERYMLRGRKTGLPVLFFPHSVWHGTQGSFILPKEFTGLLQGPAPRPCTLSVKLLGVRAPYPTGGQCLKRTPKTPEKGTPQGRV